jgi:hypothetical protein
LWGALPGYIALGALALVIGSNCGRNGECDLDDNSGCENGKVCVEGTDGVTACAICSIDKGMGCAAGEVCLADEKGAPACFCSVDKNTGCADGKVCLAMGTDKPGCYCVTETEAGCEMGTVCEEVPGTYPACFAPVTLGGHVFDLATNVSLQGAHVVARDANFAAVTGVAVTDAMGNYTLTVPSPRKPDGTLLTNEVFLRADAQNYITFPTPPRVALPIDMAKAAGNPPHLESPASSVGMVTLADTTGLGTVTGKVLAKVPIGTLVVAGGATMTGGGATGIADRDGTYTVFNVPAGSVAVTGYKVGLQLAPTTATVTAGATTMGVDLADKGLATALVSGKVEIVNPGKGTDTSVILVVDETFNSTAARGEAPPGLRVPHVTSDFSIKGVPDGNYVVLAAFENDFLVRDPDTSIGGTAIVRIKVSGGDFMIPESFKVTGSLNVVSPDKEEVVMGTPTFVWEDDSGEDHYEVRVFDTYGNLIWEKTDVPGVSGDKNVTVTYGGPALTSGQLYQFRAISIKLGGAPIAITEDLRGVFLYK